MRAPRLTALSIFISLGFCFVFQYGLQLLLLCNVFNDINVRFIYSNVSEGLEFYFKNKNIDMLQSTQ